jgi:hypothetical protein
MIEMVLPRGKVVLRTSRNASYFLSEMAALIAFVE